MNNPTDKPNPDSIEFELKALELISAGALPISAIASLLTVSSLIPVAGVSVSIGSFVALTVARQYAKSRKKGITEKLDELKASGNLDDKKYQELLATLNNLTTDGKTKDKPEVKGE